MGWSQASIRTADGGEVVAWLAMPARPGDSVRAGLVERVYGPIVGACPKCGRRLGSPDSMKHAEC